MMVPLLSSDFISRGLEAHVRQRADGPAIGRRVERLQRLCARASRELGPASGPGAVATTLAVPLARALGYRVDRHRIDERDTWWFLATPVAHTAPALPLAVLPFGASPQAEWRRLVRAAIEAGARFGLATNGRHWVIADAGRAWSRVAHSVDLERVVAVRTEALGLAVVAGASAVGGRGEASCAIDALVAASEAHRASTCRALDAGVREAIATLLAGLGRKTAARPREPTLAEQALTLVYRLLFLLYVEATGLAPLWHPVFKAHYSMHSAVERSARSASPRGLWAMLQATTRLAERGCRAGTLRVPAYDSHLFSPAAAPCGERARLDDRDAATAVRALATHRSRGARSAVRFDYGDLGVEQLGAIYERVLEDWPPAPPSSPRAMTARKATSSFYTPTAITSFLVRRTLAPLLRDRSSADILALRVLDPAMGSGAFLVGACRYLALAYEIALVNEGQVRAGDLAEADRGGFRRLVAQRCLFGVDVNPRAVELARLSLWLTTLSGDRPLTFLDHRLRCGHSLLGARLGDLHRAPAPGRDAPEEAPTLPWSEVEASLPQLVRARQDLARHPEETPGDVARKQRQLAAIDSAGGLPSAWRHMADAWVASWFWGGRAPRPAGSAYRAYCDWCLGRGHGLGRHDLDAIRSVASSTARAMRYFHWDLEFPEAFFDDEGAWHARAGFDAVLGNPPWDMLRSDEASDRRAAPPGRVVRFARESGRYPHCRDGHANQYQLFVDRALDLVAPGGRVGLVVPWGLLADAGSARLREALFQRHELDGLISFDNRHGLFPIHRSVRFALVTAARPGGDLQGHESAARLVPARLGLATTAPLDTVPDTGLPDSSTWPLHLSAGWLRRVSGPGLAVPDVRDPVGAGLLERLAEEHLRLGDPRGYGARFGRELNASDDRGRLNGVGDGWPVLEGKDVHPFLADLDEARWWVDPVQLRHRTQLVRRAHQPRLAYRDVASPTNQLTLIAAVLPPATLSTHTLFCLAPGEGEERTWVLCALLNSLLANYLVRRRVSSHVTTAIVESLTLPLVAPGSDEHDRLVTLARMLSAGRRGGGTSLFEREAYASLQGLVLRLARLTRDELRCVLDDFPLVPASTREAIARSAAIG